VRSIYHLPSRRFSSATAHCCHGTRTATHDGALSRRAPVMPLSWSSSSLLSPLVTSPTIAIGTLYRRCSAPPANGNKDVDDDDTTVVRRPPNVIASLERDHQHGWHRQTSDLLVGTSQRNGVSIAAAAAAAVAAAAAATAAAAAVAAAVAAAATAAAAVEHVASNQERDGDDDDE